MEGTRPLLVEIQALVAPSALGTPRRAVIGWDRNRLAMVLAVLEAHCGVRLGDATSISTSPAACGSAEPAADLAVAAALVSSRLDVPLPADCVYFGEVSLSGAVRPVAHAPARLKEAQKLGFRPRHAAGPRRRGCRRPRRTRADRPNWPMLVAASSPQSGARGGSMTTSGRVMDVVPQTIPPAVAALPLMIDRALRRGDARPRIVLGRTRSAAACGRPPPNG